MQTCRRITGDLIPDGGTLVFDWDNTLKLYDISSKAISSRVSKSTLKNWTLDKQCEMFIISAIRPSKMNLETLLFEVDKVGLLELFTSENDNIKIVPGKYARKGNIIICGYDKAETFLQIRDDLRQRIAVDEVDSGTNAKEGINEKVVFFDDEEVNIINFEELVPGSQCYLVQ